MTSLKTNASRMVNLPAGFEAPEGLVAVAVFEAYPDANDAGLAVLAMGGAYWMIYAEPFYVMCVEAERAAQVSAELDAYWALQGRSSSVFELWPLLAVRPWSFLIYALVLIAVFAGQSQWDLLTSGRMDASLVVGGGQVWRTATALTLHADVVHLASNCVAGIGFALLVCRLFGAGLGWLLVLLAGIAGNFMTAALYYPDPHLAIGASTAVFGALGILTASGIWMSVRQREVQLSLPQWMLPLVGGFVLLGLLGVGDGPIDVLGHLNGFLCGAVLGLLASAGKALLGRYQLLCASITILLLFALWLWALWAGMSQSALPIAAQGLGSAVIL